jgi:hypothetical protein
MIELELGEKLKRTALHEHYGGRRQGGISPSKQSANVFLFTDRIQGIQHGYIYDGQRDDGFFHYTGEGQRGDQRMAQGNRAIRDHKKEAREIHLFDAHAGVITYLGQAEYVDHYVADAPETDGGQIRAVIVFRLRLLDGNASPNLSPLDSLEHTRQKEVPVEQHLTERMLIESTREPYEAERREQELVRALMASLIAEGHDVCRLQLWPEDEPAPLYCDLYDRTTDMLIEAKGSTSRPAFRMAIGQLADYARLVEPSPAKLILAPEKPRPDLLRLARDQQIGVTWRNEAGDFESILPNGD